MKFPLDIIGDCISNGIIVVDSVSVIDYLNEVAGGILEVLPQKAIGQKIDEYLEDPFLILNVLATGEKRLGVKMEINNETFIVDSTPIKENEIVTGAVLVFQRLEQSRILSNELQITKEMIVELEGILDSSWDGIGVVDSTGRLIRLNDSFERITGIKKTEILNRCLRELVELEVFSVAPSVIALEEKRQVTMTQTANTGAKVLITSTPVFNENNEIIRVIANIRDLTELDQLHKENLKQKCLSYQYQSELESLRTQQLLPDDIVARSVEMQRVVEIAVRVAQTDTTVLIEGESGVGKEVIGRLIHRASNRKGNPYIKVNCAAIPESLMESELFGYSSGAFTGAQKGGKLGLFELAQKGTILLDEIGELPLSLQAKLLRVLEEKAVYRLGSTKSIDLDVRVIASTNRNLQEMVEKNQFRQDLYYRLRVLPIIIPPLRQREGEIQALTRLFLEKINNRFKTSKRLTFKAMNLLEKYHWPGNVRQLQNVLEALVISTETDLIDETAVGTFINIKKEGEKTNGQITKNQILPLAEAQELMERDLFKTLVNSSRSARQIGRLLGISHPTVIKKMKKYGIEIKNEK